MSAFFIDTVAKLIVILANKLIELRTTRREEIAEIERTFGPLNYLVPYYIIPDAQNVNAADFIEYNTGLVARTNALDLMSAFLAGSPSFSHAFVLSDAGMGKTSLLVMMKLFHLNKFIRPDYEMILFKIGPETLRLISEVKDPANTVLLLDALDEDQEAWVNFYSRLQVLLHSSKNFRKVIITCRTQFFPIEHEQDGHVPGEILLSGFHCSKVFLSPFTDSQVDEYLQKRFPTQAEREKARRIVLQMRSLRFRPMLLSYIDLLMSDDAVYESAFAIYHAMVEEWLNREVRKNPSTKQDILREACSIIANHMYEAKKTEIAQDELERLYSHVEGIRNMEFMTIEGRSLLHRTSWHTYKFTHYSILEYFVAQELANNPRNIQNSDQVIVFLSDLLRARKVKSAADLDLRGAYLEGARLNGLCFARANLERSKMSHCALNSADLRNTNITGADLSSASMNYAVLTSANLKGSNLAKCSLEHASLDGASLEDCQLSEVNMSSARLCTLDFTSAHMPRAKFTNIGATTIIMRKAIIPHGSFAGITVIGAIFEDATLDQCDFSGANIPEANFRNAELAGARFLKANLCGAILDNAKLSGAIFDESNLDQTSLNKIEANEIKMTKVSMKRANLSDATLCDAIINDTQLDELNLDNVDMRRANIGHAMLSNGMAKGSQLGNESVSNTIIRNYSFEQCDFVKTCFTKCTFDGVLFRKCNLRDVVFSECVLENCKFEYSDVEGAAFQTSRTSGLSFEKARYSASTTWPVGIRGETSGALGPGAILRDVRITGMNLDGIDMRGAILSDCDLSQCSLRKSNMAQLEATRSRMHLVQMGGSSLLGAHFLECDLRGVNLADCELKDARFDGSQYNDATILPPEYGKIRLLMRFSPIKVS